MWMFDNYRNRYPLRGQYLNYWGGRLSAADLVLVADLYLAREDPDPAVTSALVVDAVDGPPASAGGQHPDDRAWRSFHCTAAPRGWPGCNPHATGAYGRMDRKQATLVSGCDRAACQPHDPGSAATFTCLADAAPAAACGKRSAADASHRRCTAPEPWRPVRTRSRKLTDAGLPTRIRRVMAALRPSCPPTPRSPQRGRRSR